MELENESENSSHMHNSRLNRGDKYCAYSFHENTAAAAAWPVPGGVLVTGSGAAAGKNVQTILMNESAQAAKSEPGIRSARGIRDRRPTRSQTKATPISR